MKDYRKIATIRRTCIVILTYLIARLSYQLFRPITLRGAIAELVGLFLAVWIVLVMMEIRWICYLWREARILKRNGWNGPAPGSWEQINTRGINYGSAGSDRTESGEPRPSGMFRDE